MLGIHDLFNVDYGKCRLTILGRFLLTDENYPKCDLQISYSALYEVYIRLVFQSNTDIFAWYY